MRLRAHIYLNGLIGDSGDFFSMEPFFTPTDVRRMLDENAGAEELIVHITSRGGNVSDAFAIHDMLVGVKNLTTLGEGMVASAATILLLAAKKRQMTKYAELMIHNPMGSAEGDAEEMQKTADYLQSVEDKIAQFYADKTGNPVAKFDKWMKEETYMSAAEALDLGFITEVVEPMKAIALIPKSKKQNSFLMNAFEEISAKISKEFAQIKMALKLTKNLELTSADGRKFTVDTESNTDKASPEVNNTVTIDGKAASDGDLIVPGMGKTLVIAGGKISAINDTNAPAATPTTPAATEDSPEVKALKEQLNQKDGEIGTLKSQIASQETAINAINTEITGIKSQIISGGFKLTERTQNFNKSTDKEKPKNAFAAAAEERKARREEEAKK